MKKSIGTLIPMDALRSSIVTEQDNGTFEAGIIFLDWLEKTNQNAWQILPLHETQLEKGSRTKHIPSPYKSYSVGLDPKYLATKFAQIQPTEEQKKTFVLQHKDWIEDYALFCVIRDHFGTDDWREWDETIRKRDPLILAHWAQKYATKIAHHITVQWQLHHSYEVLRKKAKGLGIVMVGDLPYYPSVKSPLVWAHQEAFHLEKDGSMRFVSGVPDRLGAHFGRQVWGHPLYNWNKQREKVINLWKMRLHYHAMLFDHIRFDHAKAFFSYGMMDLTNEENDKLVVGPGVTVFNELVTFSQQKGLLLFAEDGDRTESLQAALKTLKIPGIKVFWFAMKKADTMFHRKYGDIAKYPTNCVAYTTTHDTETLLGYLHNLSSKQKQKLAKDANLIYDSDDNVFAYHIRDAIIHSPANMIIIPMQDWLLTTERINIPGTETESNDSNWHYQLPVPIEKLPLYFD